MKTIRALAVVAIMLLSGSVQAKFIEIAASEIVTVEPSDKSESPRILVKWDLPADLDKKLIDGAVITMTVSVDGDDPLSIDVMPLTKAWNASTADWSSRWDRQGGDFSDSIPSPAIVTENNGRRISANVYEVVMDLISARRANFGFILVPDKSSTTKTRAISANDALKLADAKLIIAYRNRR